MSFFDDLGLGAAKPGTLTSVFDPGDLLGTKSGKDAREAAKKAAAIQEASAQAGIAEQRRQFDVTQESFKPFREAGVSALEQQQSLLGLSGEEAQQAAFAGLVDSPGQKFLRDRQERALVRNAAATGGGLGGNVKTALQQQAVGFAQQDLQNQFGRLGQLAGQGQSATTSLGQFGAQASGNIQRGLSESGQARASGILGQQQARAQQQQQQTGLAATVGSFFLSDPKLKDDVEKIGVANGFNWYTWTWNALANKIGLFGDSWGVMADQVKAIKPELITEKNGYMMVNYSGLGA